MVYQHGWYQVGFERDLEQDVTPAHVGKKRLILVKGADGVQAYSADCPHRGAHLGFGGRLVDGCSGIVCPFHGYKVALGGDENKVFRVPAYKTVTRGGLIFVRLSDSHDSGFETFIDDVARGYTIVPGFKLHVNCSAELVIENGFDNRHFPAVHGVTNDPVFDVEHAANGKIIVRSIFEVPASPGPVPYEAHCFSPGLVTVHLKGQPPYSVITGSLPNPDGTATIHLSLAFPRAVHGDGPNRFFVEHLLKHSRRGLEEDRPMWEGMSFDCRHNYTAQDNAVLAFHRFCADFGARVPAPEAERELVFGD